MLINSTIKKLVVNIQAKPQPTPYIIELIQTLAQNCSHKPIEFNNTSNVSEKYPIIGAYAKAFDVLLEEEALIEAWNRYGFVVSAQVVSQKKCCETIETMFHIMNQLGMNLDEPNTWTQDENQVSILSRGFFELYHDNILAQLRQSIKLYLHHVVLWQTPFLWTSFDRLGLKLPQGTESKGLPLHVDQNPTVHPNFKTLQGVLALNDCPIERGTFVVVPQSINHFSQYKNFVSEPYKGEYIQLPIDCPLYEKIHQNAQLIPIKQGDFISWDSRTTHANSTNYSNENRYVAYLSTGVAKEFNSNEQQLRKEAFQTGLGSNCRDAYMHASKKPRYTSAKLGDLRKPEELTLLGQCLYGFVDYKGLL